jgi:hypothetical protein
MESRKNLKRYVDAITDEQSVGMVAQLLSAGFDRDEVRDVLPELLDDLLVFEILVPGPGGVILEQLDGPALRALVRALWPVILKRAERRSAKLRVEG